jgi:hypothetical protein
MAAQEGFISITRRDPGARLRNLAERQRSLIKRISRIEIEADAIAQELFELIEEDYVIARVSKAPGKYEAARTLKEMADAGVATLEIKPRSDGLSDARIDGGKAFTLPPMLADLLYVLSIDSGRSFDNMVGFKTFAEVAILLRKKAGKELTRRAVVQNIFRLRNELRTRGGVNPFLIQTNRRLGVRFALRRRVDPLIGCDQ